MTQNLCLPNGINCFKRFKFTNYEIINHDIKPKPFLKYDIVKYNRNV